MCSKYVNHFKLKSQHNWRGLCNRVVTSWSSPLDILELSMLLNLAYSTTFMVQLDSRIRELTLCFIANNYHLPKNKPAYCHIHITNIDYGWKMHITLIFSSSFCNENSPPISLSKNICGKWMRTSTLSN